MNNLRKTVVLLFIGVLAISMALVPFTPFANNDSQVAAPTDYQREFVEKWADRLENDFMAERVDPILVSYMETGVLDSKVVTTRSGDAKLLLYIDPAFDINALAGIAKVRWQIDLKLTRVASVEISSVIALKQLDAMDGVRYIQADVFLDREPVSYNGDDASLDMFNINDVVGATQANALGYTGEGVIVGVDDTGVDFSQMDMWGTEYHNGTHPMSYDPSSYGLTEMYIANNTFVENTTAWLEAGNLLTYEMGGKYYLNVSGWDPVCNNVGGHRNLLGLLPPYGYGYPYGSVIGFIGLYEWAWGPVNNVSEFVYNEMWKDWEIPTPGAENYTFGWVFQQKMSGYAKVFATSMYYEGNIIIDWNSSLGWSTMWQNALNLQNIDLNTTADRNAILAMMDWSFKDDYDEGFVFNRVNNVLYADGLVDGSHSMGLGSLSWAYDGLGYLAHDPGLFCGYTDDGMVWNAMFPGGDTAQDDGENHGHWTAATVASQGTYDHDVYANGSAYKLPGVAPDAKIIATKGLSTGGDLMADFWAAGFHLNESAGPYGNLSYWEYTGDGPSHHANIVSNSWGWGPGASYLQMRLFTMVYDIASVPDVLKTGYPGTLFVFSAGNHGGDYGTMGSPAASFSVISVGGTITNHFYQGSVSQYPQTDNQHIWFAGMGPHYTGAVKPDVVAPGYRGANPQPGHNDWLYPNDPDYNEFYNSYFWWQGTSLSCPIVAGVAAIIMQAWNDNVGGLPSPQLTKNLVLSTASDLGYDPFIQGHGLVNAEAAVLAIESGSAGEFYFESNSFANFADQIADAWAYWIPDWAPFGIYYDASWTTPVGLETSSIFYGTVERGQSYTVNLDVQGFNGASYDTAGFTQIQPWYYSELSTVSQAYTSYRYNDTNFEPYVLRSGYFVLSDLMDLTDFYAADYATIYVTYDAADIGEYPTVNLYDWLDDGEMNYWNFTTDTGDDLSLVTRYYDQCNVMTLRIAAPAFSTLASVFDNEPTLQFFGSAGIDFNVTITAWQKVLDNTIITYADGSTSGIDFTLNVPADAEYGAHEGSILMANSTWSHHIPYSYMVDFNLDGAEGAVHTLVDTLGDERTPYDTGAVTTSFVYGSTSTYEGGGLYTFHLDIPYNIAINASVLVMRAQWANQGTVVDMYLQNEIGQGITNTADRPGSGDPFDPAPTGDLTNTIIYDPDDLINGTYWFYYSIHVFDGADVPENITITMQIYGPTSLQPAENSFWWTARDMTTPTPIAPDDVLVADYIDITSNWSIPAVSGLPEYSTITGTQLSLLSGLYVTFDGIYADPAGYDNWPVPLSAIGTYNWHTVDGIVQDDIVQVDIDSQDGADPAFQVYPWNDADADDEVDLDELGPVLLDRDQGTTGGAESGSFSATEDMSIAVLVFNFAYVYFPGNHYFLEVDTRVAIDNPSVSDTAIFETYKLLVNKTMDIYLYCYTETDVVWIIDFGKVTFRNFFAPVVTINPAIDLGDDTFNFTFSATDANEGDSIFYSVWISADGGVSYQLVAMNLTETFFVWDSDGWYEGDYYYRVRVFSVDLSIMVDGVPLGTAHGPPDSYGPMTISADAVYGPFSAGNVPVTTPPTTTPTTPTTPTTTTPPILLDPLLIGLIGGIGVGVVVLLILFLIRKK